MTRTETDRDDPSDGKSGASPSASGTGRKSETVQLDPQTDQLANADKLPQASPVPDVVRALREANEPHGDQSDKSRPDKPGE